MLERTLIQRVNFYDNPGVLKEIIALQDYMPEYLKEDHRRIASNLQDPRNINVLMRDGSSNEAFCYAFATPQHQQLVSEFIHDDPLMPVDEKRYYIDQVVAKEDARRGVVFFSRIVHAVFAEANKMDFFKFSVHALCANGVDKVIARVFRSGIYLKRKALLSRFGGAEYVYMEAFYGPERRRVASKIDYIGSERRKINSEKVVSRE